MPSNIYVGLVDDDESLCRSLARLLRASGYQPIIYLSAEAFFSDAHCSRFDCLILDVQLGGMSGIELAERLASTGATTPVIFVTAHEDPKVREQAFGVGCIDYLRKSDSGDAVLAAVAQTVRQAAGEKAMLPSSWN